MTGRNFKNNGMKYGALAGFVGSELYIVGLAAFWRYSTPDVWVTILLGQVIGALPAVILGAVLGRFGGFLFAKFPDTFAKGGGVLGGVFYAFSMYLLLAGLLTLFGGRDFELFSVLFNYIKSPSPTPLDADFLLSYLGVFMLYLCAGAWGGSKLDKLTQDH